MNQGFVHRKNLPRPKPLTPARQNDVAVRTAPSTVSAVSAKKIVLVLSDASGYDLRSESNSEACCLNFIGYVF